MAALDVGGVRGPSAAMQQQLAALVGRGGTFGGWVGLWRESASAVGGEPFVALTRACDASPALEALARALEADKEAFGDEGGALVAALKRGQKHGPLGFFDFLATFRNRVYGHGAMLPEAVARRLALPFLGATSHVLRLPALFDGAWLGRTAVDVLGADGRHYWKRLHGVSEAAVEPTDELPSADEPSPRCLYFVPDPRRRASGLGVEGDAAPESGALPVRAQPVSLSFLVVQDEDATGLSRFGFFQRALGRKGSERGERKTRGIEYLDYLGGAFRDDTLADELARLAPAVLGDAGGPGDDTSASDEGERPAAGRRSERRFGDFVIEAELGRGAMGIVYRATQRALGRSVALKVLPPALLEDPIALGRFHREVQALGRCDHPNVVRVLASGIEEGRPWFAMELVEGADLAAVYATLVRWKGERELTAGHLQAASSSRRRRATGRAAGQAAARAAASDERDPTSDERAHAGREPDATPAPGAAVEARTLSELARGAPPLPAELADHGSVYDRLALLFAAAADGVEEVHRRGLVHRDLKPANLMLTADGERLVVMDLGLAKTTDASVSYTAAGGGDFVGSARYAAPEQLQAKLLKVDHRADIYSLGATLYELATQAPIYPSDDVTELLQQKLALEPRPARELERRVPRELEIVLQKCLARRPEERYQSAAELADDLRACAERRPIRARPPSAFEYLRLFHARQKGLVRLAGVGLLAVVGLVAVSFVLVSRERADALRERDAARDARGLADAERERAEKLAAFVADDLYQRLKPMGRLDLLDAVSERIVEYYRSLDRRAPGIAARYADALIRLGKAREPRGKLDEARGYYEEGRAAVEAVLAASPADRELVTVRARALDALARISAKQNQLAQALGLAEQSLAARVELAVASPDDVKAQHDLASSHKTVAAVLEDEGRGSEALAAHRAALERLEGLAATGSELLEVQHDLAGSYNSVGDLLVAQGKREDALAAYAKALAVASRLVDRDALNATAQRFLAASHESIGMAHAASGASEPALAAYRQALDIRERLAKLDPSNAGWQNDLSMTYHHLAETLADRGELAEAETFYRRDLAITERLAAADPTNAGWQHDLSVSINNLGSLGEARGDRAGALAEYRRALAIRERLSAGDPANVEWKRELAVSHARVGRLLEAGGEHEAALASLEKDAAIARELALRDPDNTSWQRDLAVSEATLAEVYLGMNRLDEAIVALDRSLALREKLAAADPENGSLRRDLAVTHGEMGALLERRGRVDRAEVELRRALALLDAGGARRGDSAQRGDGAHDPAKADAWRELEKIALLKRDARRNRDSKSRSYNDMNFDME